MFYKHVLHCQIYTTLSSTPILPTQNINVTTLKINVIILLTRQVQEKLREQLGVEEV